MAELASGAVSSLLGLLRNEALLLGRVGNDVEFIKEEMESMHSFLEHLARTAPPVGGHDAQVRTWMRQVRDLAHDCSNCIDLYLQRGDPAVYHARVGRWRYLWWASWLLQKIIAQHKAAIRLGELKERARDVGERRFRYGVEIPGKATGAGGPGAAPSTQAAAVLVAAEEEDEDDDVHIQAAVVADSSDPRRRALELCTVEDYCAYRLADWLKLLKTKTKKARSVMPSIAIVTPDKADACNVAHDTSVTVGAHFEYRVLVDLHVVHLYFLILKPFDILYYILWKIEHEKSQSQQQGTDQAKEEQQGNDDDNNSGGGGEEDEDDDEEEEEEEEDDDEDDEEDEDQDDEDNDDGIDSASWQVNTEKLEVYNKIMGKIKKMKVGIKVKQIKSKIEEMKVDLLSLNMVGQKFIGASFVLLMALLLLNSPSHEPIDLERAMNKARRILEWDKKRITKKMATELKNHMEAGGTTQIRLNLAQYEGILREMRLLPTSKSKPQQDQEQVILPAASSTSGEHQNKQEDTFVPVEIQATGKQGQQQIRSATEETKKKMNKIKRNIAEQLLVKGIVDKIEGHLQNKRALVILNDNKNYISRWEEIRNALSLLVDCVAGTVIMTTTKDRERAKRFCYPPGEPITYSLVGRYHDTVLQFIGQRMNKDDDYNLDILKKCDPYEFCMKIFAHALYSNPNRSSEELRMLCDDLQDSKNSWATNAKKMFKFSYNDLPREHKSCLLYLAIFPQGYNIQRSTIIGRWVTEGLITKEDWHTAVRHAERCFDNLINRCLVLPDVIGAAGKVKSCVVGDEVHGYITKIAYKEHILNARLSKQWARHFSIFSGLRLRASDNINKFVQKLPKYSTQLPLLKVLDLEGCHCLGRDHYRYLKDICSKILLLKYLSLRGTDITHLPREINNLHELEVLDIRQTNKLPERETRDVLLLKLKRLLAGHVDPSTSSHCMGMPVRDNNSSCTSVRIPCKIEKMENMEVLSNVKASRHGDELKDIRKLWRLRKLGVVIDDKEAHLRNFLRVASDLKESLQSVSITITETRSEGTLSIEELLPDNMHRRLIQSPKHLESLSISGTSQKGQLLPLLAKGSNELAKVTLSSTALNQDNLHDLGELPNLRRVRLRHEAYTQSKFTFKKNEFQPLKYFLVEGPNMTDIIFEDGAASGLEKIILAFTKIKSLCGVGSLPKLTELELKGNEFLLSLFEDGVDTELNTKSRSFTFKEKEFQHLKYFLVEGSNMTDIIFEEGALPELEKIILSCTNIKSLRGVDKLPKLKELELKQNKLLLSLFENANQITKVILCDTLLKQSDLHTLAKKPYMTCLELLDKSYDESKLIFDKDTFPKLNILIVKCSGITHVSFTNGSAPNLKKFLWSFTKIESLSGIDNLLKLKELEFNGEFVPHQVRKDIESHKKQPFLIHKKPQQQDQAKGSVLEDDDDARFSPISWISKKKDRR